MRNIGNMRLEDIQMDVHTILSSVYDPEIPVLSLHDLGVLRDVEVLPSGKDPRVRITVTPTYSGCPALDMMKMQIRLALLEKGYHDIEIIESLSPAWTTDWMSQEGKDKLKAYGIAPPQPSQSVCDLNLFQEEEAIACPRCNSFHTRMISRFGSTPCKSLYRCEDCQEPFDYFKCH